MIPVRLIHSGSTNMPRVLIACEYSGVVRSAFSRLGWDAWSCDILPTDIPGNHFQCSVLDVLNEHITQLRKFKSALEKENFDYLEELITNANKIRGILDK